MTVGPGGPRGQNSVWPDDRLVRECLDGNEQAWTAFLDKYKNLIFSIALKWQMTREDADEIFQDVCATVVGELAQLRNPKALPSWLIQIASRKCLKWKREHDRYASPGEDADEPVESGKIAEELLQELEQEQTLREVVKQLPAPCAQLIKMLFFHVPPLPYEQVANSLGVAEGSIGFMRGRCLERLRRELKQRGFS